MFDCYVNSKSTCSGLSHRFVHDTCEDGCSTVILMMRVSSNYISAVIDGYVEHAN